MNARIHKPSADTYLRSFKLTENGSRLLPNSFHKQLEANRGDHVHEHVELVHDSGKSVFVEKEQAGAI